MRDGGCFQTLLPATFDKPFYKGSIITRPIHGAGDVLDGGPRHPSPPPTTSTTAAPEPLDLRREDHRLKTLNNWPPRFMDAAKTARAGFYYYGDRDMVRCYFCKIELHKWKEGDDIVTDHVRWSPNCPLLTGLPCGNVPLSVDECGTTQQSRGPAHPAYMTFQSRLATFRNWPAHLKQTPQMLADSGFYYTGIEDQTLCYHCGGGLKDWEDNDDPWEQHITWFARCPYVLAVKGEQYAKSMGTRGTTGESSSASTPPITDCSNSNSNSDNTAPAPASADLEKTSDIIIKKAVSSDRSTTSLDAGARVDEDKLCKICYGEERTVCFVPCGHVVACPKCAMSVLTCPICRKPFTSTIRLYYS